MPLLDQYVLTPSTTNALNPQPVALPPSTIFTLNSDGNGNEFELTFSRDQLDNPIGVAQPCPNIAPATPTPSPAAGPSVTTAPTSAPTGTAAGATASPAAIPTPYAAPTTAAQQYWYFNLLTFQGGVVIDSLGNGGAQDTTFNGIGVETGTTLPYVYNKPAGTTGSPSDPAAIVTGIEVDNYK